MINDLKAHDITDLIAVTAIAIGFFLSIHMHEKDLALMLGGTLGGVLGMSAKNAIK